MLQNNSDQRASLVQMVTVDVCLELPCSTLMRDTRYSDGGFRSIRQANVSLVPQIRPGPLRSISNSLFSNPHAI
jgi:hypothetical protein